MVNALIFVKMDLVFVIRTLPDKHAKKEFVQDSHKTALKEVPVLEIAPTLTVTAPLIGQEMIALYH